MRGRKNYGKLKRAFALLLVALFVVNCISHIASAGNICIAQEVHEQQLTVRVTRSSGDIIENSGSSLIEAVGGEEAAVDITVLEILSGTVMNEDWGNIVKFEKLTEFLVSDIVRSEAVTLSGSRDLQDPGLFPQTIKRVELPHGVKEVGIHTFNQCSCLEEVKLPESVVTIGIGAFYSCINLTSVKLGGGLKNIRGSAFYMCQKLKKIELPDTVAKIDTAAFSMCYELEEITMPATQQTQLGGLVFSHCYKLARMNIIISDTGNVEPLSVPDDDNFRDCLDSRQIFFYTKKGIPLSHATTPTWEQAKDAYLAVEDGDTMDTKWYGWEIGKADPVYEMTVKTDGDGKTVLKTEETTVATEGNAVQQILIKDGHTAELTFVPEEGCSLLSVSIDGETVTVTGNTYRISDVGDNHTVNVSFSKKLTTTPTPSPTSSPTPEPTKSPVSEPALEPGATPETTPIAVSTIEPAMEPTVSPTPGQTIMPTPVPGKDVSDIANGLGVSGETAEKIQAVAKDLDVSKDTILVTDKTITSQKTDKDIKGAYFARIQARVSQITQNNVKLVWNKVKGADGYLVYGNRCNTKKWIYEYKLTKTIKDSSKRSYIERKCKKGSYYKFVVRAYKNIDGKKVTIAVSKTIHVVTNGGKNGNAGSVMVNKTKISLKKGKSIRLKAKETKKKKKLRHHRQICFESSDPKVASISRNGVVKGKKKGKCNIYAYAQNGIYKKVKIIVK